MLRSENGRPVTWIYVDGRGSDMQTMVGDIQRVITAKVKLPPASAFPILVSTSFSSAPRSG
jgi:Cu/Ag efflux pump CusA